MVAISQVTTRMFSMARKKDPGRIDLFRTGLLSKHQKMKAANFTVKIWAIEVTGTTKT